MSETDAEVAPCPFCVEPKIGPKYREWRGDSWVDHNVVCEDCIAVGPDGSSKADAIERWNKRAVVPEDRPAS